MTIFIHETAIVDEGAKIGSGTKIWHFSHISSKVDIGEGCSFGQNVYIANNVRIGRSVKIQNNVSVYEGVELDDYVFCGPSMVFTNVRSPRAKFPTESDAYEVTRVCRGATIGANATIVCGTTIGSWAFVAAGTVITKDVPAYALMAGVPALQIGWVCVCGETLKLDSAVGHCKCSRNYCLNNNQLSQVEASPG